MGIDVVITQRTIAKLLSTPKSGRFVVGTKDNNPKADAIKWCLLDNADNL